MAHTQKPEFVFRRKGRVHLNRRGRQFSRLLAADVCASVVVMLDTPCSEVVWRVLATHSIRQFPLHFPSHASPRPITFQLDSTVWDPALRPQTHRCFENQCTLCCTVFENTCSQTQGQNGSNTAPLTRECKSFCVDVAWNYVHEKRMHVLQFLTGTQSPLRSCRRANHTTVRGPSAIQAQSRSDAISVPYNPVGFSAHFSELLLLKNHCLFTALQYLV